MDLLGSGWGIWTKVVRGCLFDDDVCDEDGNPDRNGVGVLILGISARSEVESNFMPKCCVITCGCLMGVGITHMLAENGTDGRSCLTYKMMFPH